MLLYLCIDAHFLKGWASSRLLHYGSVIIKTRPNQTVQINQSRN